MFIKNILKHFNKKTLIFLFITPLLISGFLTYLFVHSFYFEDYVLHGISYNKEAPNFELHNHEGSKTHLADLKGEYVLITFGYTHCPDVCPTTLSALNRTLNELDSLQDDVRVLFITVDPQRDTEKRLKEYIPFFNENFVGLTGDQESLEKIAKSYSVFYEKVDGESKAGYFLNHTPSVYLIDPEGRLSLIYPYDKVNPGKIARDIRHLNKNQEKSL